MKRISNCYKTGEKRILGLMSTSLDGLDLKLVKARIKLQKLLFIQERKESLKF